MNLTENDGASFGAHLRKAQEAGKKVAELEEAGEIPEPAYLFSWFWELRAGIPGNGFGPVPIAHTELNAWMENIGMRLHSWEIMVLRQMDLAYLGVHTENSRNKSNKIKSNPKPISKAPRRAGKR